MSGVAADIDEKPRKRWRSAFKKVRRQKSEKDIYGDAFTDAINRSAEFSFAQRASGEALLATRNNFVFPPFISKHNFDVLSTRIRGLLGSARGDVKHQDGNRSSNSNMKLQQSLTASLMFFLGVFFGLSLVSTWIFHKAALLSSRLLYMAVGILVDWDEVKGYCPAFVITILERLKKFAIFLDSWLLQGRRFSGREWNRSEIEWDAAGDAESWNSSLYELPPPTIQAVGKQNCLDEKQLEQQRWGKATVCHHIGINYCFVVLQEEELQRAARRRRTETVPSAAFQEQMLLSSSTSSHPVVDSTDSQHDNVQMEHGVEVFPSTSLHREIPDLETIGRAPRSTNVFRDSSPLPTIWNQSYESGLISPCLSDVADHRSDCDQQSIGSDKAGDMPWIDVGAKIGMRLLNSSHVQRAMASKEAKDRLISRTEGGQDVSFSGFSDVASTIAGVVSETGVSLDPDKIIRPVHPMWTSATAAATPASPQASCSDMESDFGSVFSDFDADVLSDNSEPRLQRDRGDFPRPPLSPHSSPARNQRKSFVRPINSKMRGESHHDTAQSCNINPLLLPEIKHVSDRSCIEARRKMHVSAVCDKSRDPSLGPAVECMLHEEKRPSNRRCFVREPLEKGVKVAVPLFPSHPSRKKGDSRLVSKHFQMGTVVNSHRTLVEDGASIQDYTSYDTNCLSVTVQLDRCFLRNGEFARLTFRIPDSWSARHMPKHSKVPIGSCVATKFGIGVLVGWRVEDDIHVVGSFWQRRGPGSARAYLNREFVNGVVNAAVGFHVQTRLGPGVVCGYKGDSTDFATGSFSVTIENEGKPENFDLERKDILSCNGAQFMPVIEHIREAANFQLQLDNYDAAIRAKRALEGNGVSGERSVWHVWSECGEIFWKSFLRAVEEDKDFDEGVNEFMASIISFLEKLDGGPSAPFMDTGDYAANEEEIECVASPTSVSEKQGVKSGQEPGFWILNDILGDVFGSSEVATEAQDRAEKDGFDDYKPENSKSYERIFGILNIIMKTVSISKASSADHHHFRLALAIAYDGLLFIRTLVKVQRKNVSAHSIKVWKHALDEIVATFGPIKDRIQKVGFGIALRMEKQGRKAKIRTLKFVDTILGDDRLLFALEQGDWRVCATRLEFALVQSEVIQEEHRLYYRKAMRFLNEQLDGKISTQGGAAERNNAKLALLIKFVQYVAAPRRSLLKVFKSEGMLETFERILVRVFEKEELASRMLTIHASNFHSLRHFRMLKDLSTSGRIWIPLMDAADEEFSWIASQMPENAREIVCPLSSLFSLCVAQFHKIYAGNTNSDWLDFLFEEDAVRIIHDIDLKLILAVESFSRDVKEMVSVVPYYANIDDDILKLMDEVDMDEFLKEGFEAIDDPEKLAQFVREKTTVAMERFLNYLPKLSIPVEKRDLGEGWILTCHGADGGDLTLSDVHIRRENLVCKVIGSELLYIPNSVNGENEGAQTPRGDISSSLPIDLPDESLEETILDHIRQMILQAQGHGCWRVGFGGIEKPPSDSHIASVLHRLPVSSVLNCALELWRTNEMDDDELLEIAIRDVSYQIQLQKEQEDSGDGECSIYRSVSQPPSIDSRSFDKGYDKGYNKRFNPREDPTVLYVEMKSLTLKLDDFSFRIEKSKRTIFDPVFDGRGTLSIHNITIKLRVECAKERRSSPKKGKSSSDPFSPILKLREFEVDLERVGLEVKDTGFGSDWILNRAVQVFESNITRAVADNLKEQIRVQVKTTIQNLNDYFQVHPNMLLNILGIGLGDLEEHIVFV